MAFIGSCPDMCPERERKTRVGHSVSIFERHLSNEPNEYAMVKEYRRSGADQEEPAPEDLRTIGALQKTLDYLVCNIMNDSRSITQELALEWYDFLWDRLRAIRKDITQQNICDPNSAILVERCARFHVHSCYAMNRVKDFDVDMNKRNLNDCLQMLRQIYHDLKTANGETCPGELEFQKYDILLHLDQDHLSSTILMKCSEYRPSTEMRFITKLFSAYTNNDYYQLFQLMRQADYMTSCLLSLYANKMRLAGLKAIINACARGQSVLYPSELAIEILGFDDHHDLSQFAEVVGIGTQVKDDKMHLVLNRDVLSLLRNSEPLLPAFKSIRLVEDKKQGLSVGQMVHGGTELPDNDETDCSMIVSQEFMVEHEEIAETTNDSLRSGGSKRKICEEAEEETTETLSTAVEEERDVKRQRGADGGRAPQFKRRLEDRTIIVSEEEESTTIEETLIVATVRDESSRSAQQLKLRWLVDGKEIGSHSSQSDSSDESLSYWVENFYDETGDECRHKLVIRRTKSRGSRVPAGGRRTVECEARNQFGEARTSCQVRWVKRPRFLRSLEDTDTQVGETVVMKVTVEEEEEAAATATATTTTSSSKSGHNDIRFLHDGKLVFSSKRDGQQKDVTAASKSKVRVKSYEEIVEEEEKETTTTTTTTTVTRRRFSRPSVQKRRGRTYEICIVNTQVDQQGTWQCEAQNEAGESSCRADLEVFEEPKIVTDLHADVPVSPSEKTLHTTDDSSSPKSVDKLFEDGFGSLEEEERVFTNIKFGTSRPTPEARAEIADVMPAGFFKVRSLSSAQPILRPPPKLASDYSTPTRRFKPVNNIQKKLDSISLTIEDEKRANKVFARLKDMFTR